MKKVLLVALVILLNVVLTFAQTTSGRLSGTVSSPDGVLPNATVTAKDSVTGKSQTVTSKEDGSYLFPQLEFGVYSVTVTASGFKTYAANEVKIDVGRDYSLNPTLEVGNVQETVTVTAGADVVTATSAQVSNTISPQQILSLPLLTRNPLALTTLQAGVASNPFQNTSINGMRTTLTNITRDGINIQDTFIRSNATDFAPGRPSVDDTSEFTISLTNQEADQGYGGAQIRLVTPRGTKNFTGALFAYNRNSAFAANSFFNNRTPNNADGTQAALAVKPSFRNRNQYGGKISGPFPVFHFGEGGPMFDKDKGFFFFSFEGVKDPLSASATRTILTPSARTGAFQYTRATAGDAINTNINGANVVCPAWATGAPTVTCSISNILAFGQNVFGAANIASTAVNPTIQSRVISLLPTASNFTGGDGLNTAGYRLDRRSDQNRNTYTTRVDVDATAKDNFNVVYSFNNESNLRPDADTTKFTVVPGVIQTSANDTLVGTYRRIFSSTIVNEFKMGTFISAVPFDRTDEKPGFFLGVPLVTNPENGFLSQGRNTQGTNFQNNVDWIVGRHSLRFGGQLQFFKVDAYNEALIVPSYTVGTTSLNAATNTTFSTTNFATIGGINTTQVGTANGLLALFGGIVSGGSQSFNVADAASGFQVIPLVQPFRYSNHSLYLSDRWSAVRGLTISAGIRYELFPSMTLQNGVGLEPVITDPNNIQASLLSTAGTYNVLGTNAGKKNAYYKTDYDNFAPSIGIAYSPNFESGFLKFLTGGEGKTVLRGGYSHTYGNDSIVTSLNNAVTGNVGFGRTGSNAIGPLGNTSLNDRLSGALTGIAPPTFIVPPRTFLQNNSAAVAGNFGTVFAVDPNIQIPRVDQYSAGLQREIGNTAFEIRYVGSSSKNLVRGLDYNQIDIFNNGFLADFQRATSNRTNTGNAFCNPAAVAGCQALTIFRSSAAATATTVGGAVAGAGTLLVGTGGLSATTFNNGLIGGTPADLALSWVTGGFNNHPTVANPTAAPFVKLLPNPGTGVVDLMLNDARYYYNSLQIEVRRRFSKGFYMQANYSFSKNLTDGVGTSQALFEPYLDNNRKSLDYQLADFDQTHTFNFNGIYQLPFGKGKTFLNEGGVIDKVFGGWEFSSIIQWGTGAPITFTDARGTFNRAGRSGRQTPFSNLTNEQIRDLTGIFERGGNIYFIDPSIINTTGRASEGFGSTPFTGQIFFSVNPGQIGNVGRAIIRGPRTFNINSALLKNVRFGETIKVQLRAEAFNLLNNVNLTNNSQFPGITSTTFGQIQSAGAPRTMQFAFRFEF